MPHQLSLRPGLRQGSYPQKQESRLNDLEQIFSRLFQRIHNSLSRKQYTQAKIVKQINHYQQILQDSSEAELTHKIQQLSDQLYRQGLQHPLMIEAFAIIREIADRTLNTRHFDVQLYAGWLMIYGRLAEMQTGEGKTLAATLPSCTAALSGIPVHVITANDYLAARDAENMAPLYKRLGLSSASIVEGMGTEQRHLAYQCDIVHISNKQIVFDYLRDRLEMQNDTGQLRFQYRQIQRQRHAEQLLLRGLCFALIDEADNVLIDEAKTPLIISKTLPEQEAAETYSDALYLASTLTIKQHFNINIKTREIELTFEGKDHLADSIIGLDKQWHNKRKREMLVKLALSANIFFKNNKDYVIIEGKIQIVDPFTGRVMADRSWEQGLHQMIEAKEGCLISERREPLARISYQRFYSRYLRLAGASGTLSEVSSELQQVYGLKVVKVARNKALQRNMQAHRIYRNQEIKQQIFIKRIGKLHQQQRPILIGTCSVEESEQVSHWLKQAEFPHLVLNAKQDKYEAEIIAKAGQLKAITVATNMAGRGTDIALGSGVAELGGLHIISLSCNDLYRIDRQLYGRCARQGDPGSSEAILSLQDPALVKFYASAILKLMARLSSGNKPVPNFIAKWIIRSLQQKKQKEQQQIRKLLIKQDRHLQRILAFSGKFE